MSKIICAVNDLIFSSKITETAKAVGKKIEFVSNKEYLLEKANSETNLVIFDLNAAEFDAFEIVNELKEKGIKLIGYLGHTQTELIKKAREAGFDFVYPRSRFTEELSRIIKEFG